jgi:lysophospholipase
MKHAPLAHDIAEAPDYGRAYWCNAPDGLRLRVGHWPNADVAKGSILIFPGRTEYVEKYGRTISELTKRGYSVLVVDWRGQGLSDRSADDRRMGHVIRFSDYQNDVAAMVNAAEALELPRPWFMLGHSLGACIGLRALSAGIDMSACAFTAPMWGINLPAIKRAVAWPLSWSGQALGLGARYAPGMDGASYVLANAFDVNRLTSDGDMYRYFIAQAQGLTTHQIGGPSLGWLYQTLRETRALSQVPSPDIPCLVFCGRRDAVIDLQRVEDRMARWPNGTLSMIGDGKHDLLSEVPTIRDDVIARIDGFFGG